MTSHHSDQLRPRRELASVRWERWSMVPGAIGIFFFFVDMFLVLPALAILLLFLLLHAALDSRSQITESLFAAFVCGVGVFFAGLILALIFAAPYKLMESLSLRCIREERTRRRNSICLHCSYPMPAPSALHARSCQAPRCPECGEFQT